MRAILDLPEIRELVRRWTVPEYEKLGDDPVFARSELIRGIIIEKMPRTPLHEFLTDTAAASLRAKVSAGYVVGQEASLRLADSVPEPDVAIVAGTKEDFRTRHPTTAELVVEVAVSSVALDRENASLYAEAGVTEYWIILAAAEQVEVYRRLSVGSYQERRRYRRGDIIENVKGLDGAVTVDLLFA